MRDYDPAFNDRTVPMQAPPPSTPPPMSSFTPRSPAPRPAAAGCGVALGVLGGIFIGAILATIITVLVLSPRAVPSVTSAQTNGALKVTITDAFLNQAMSAQTSTSPVTITNPQAHFQSNGELTISGVLQNTPLGSAGKLVIVLAPTISQGQLSVTAVSGSFAGIAVPPVALQPIANAINQQLSQSSSISLGAGSRLIVTGLTFGNGSMTIVYGIGS